jgi:hypothetical protein
MGISLRGRSAGRLLGFGGTEDRLCFLLVAGKPGDDFFGRARCHQDIVATDHYPLPNEWPQCLCQRLRPGGRAGLCGRAGDARGAATTVFPWVRRAAGGEPEAGQRPTSARVS